MNRLSHDFLALVLIVYGLTVGCWDGEHRVARVVVHGGTHLYNCKCGARTPYTEIWKT